MYPCGVWVVVEDEGEAGARAPAWAASARLSGYCSASEWGGVLSPPSLCDDVKESEHRFVKHEYKCCNAITYRTFQ